MLKRKIGNVEEQKKNRLYTHTFQCGMLNSEHQKKRASGRRCDSANNLFSRRRACEKSATFVFCLGGGGLGGGWLGGGFFGLGAYGKLFR